jgi:hypothetical protein
MESVLVTLIWLLVYALVVALVCWVVTKIMATFAPDMVAYAWIVWAIGGLLLIVLALRLLSPLLGG